MSDFDVSRAACDSRKSGLDLGLEQLAKLIRRAGDDGLWLKVDSDCLQAYSLYGIEDMDAVEDGVRFADASSLLDLVGGFYPE